MTATFYLPNGVRIVVDSPWDAALLAKQLSMPPSSPPAPPTQSSAPPPPAPPTPPTQPPPDSSASKANLFRMLRSAPAVLIARRFLELVKAGNGKPGGLTTDDVKVALGAEHPKGVGAKLGMVNELLTKLELEPTEVYLTMKTLGGRFWEPGPKIDQAIKLLNEVVHTEIG
jgi:hypothetical protein